MKVKKRDIWKEANGNRLNCKYNIHLFICESRLDFK